MIALTQSFPQAVPAIVLFSISAYGIYALHVFSLRNGTFEFFFKFLNNRRLPDGTAFQAIDTKGRIPFIDKQVCAFAMFMLAFTSDFSHPDTTLAGFLFLGAWGPAWVLIVLESFRIANAGHPLSYLAIPGYIIFHHSHALGTPLYLGLLMLWSPSAQPQAQTPEKLLIDENHLGLIPISFVLGYIVPIILMALPAPKVVSYKFKHTVTGWYQQWHIIIACLHYGILWTLSQAGLSIESHETSPETTLSLLRITYCLTFLLAAIPYLSVTTISAFSYLAPSLFLKKTVLRLQPAAVLVPTSPWSKKKAGDMQEGFKWLIQWDYIIGTAGTTVWALTLRANAARVCGVSENIPSLLLRMAGYFCLGGPVAVPVGLMWERDEMVFRQR